MRIASGDVYILALYTGHETRMNLNSKKAMDKFGKTDFEINRIFKIVFVIFLIFALALFLLSG